MRSDTMPTFRIGVMKAMNGRILEVSTYKPNNHGPDWTTEMFIVPEDQTLTQALTTLLVLKGLNT
jgi:Mg/Co/Ni transporter MgtE